MGEGVIGIGGSSGWVFEKERAWLKRRSFFGVLAGTTAALGDTAAERCRDKATEDNVDGRFQTVVLESFAIGDLAAFPLKLRLSVLVFDDAGRERTY
ncbi:hypothetical protein RHMOL_Rhmol12G0096300 [Rhododendron molle]|uniref:Uncharacterized protein n=1 Tax=Rhododendron molle TaxID=49168 RepID=A0ACC0LG40_RHOML|nr:hypothetical protein RHMOL_Rhmol12G0096300 [Rhododendron molle]